MFFKGAITGASTDPDNNNVCILQYETIFYGIVAVEEVFFEWESISTDSYRFFKRIVDALDAYHIVDAHCHIHEIIEYARWNMMQDDFWSKDFPTIFGRELGKFIPAFFIGIYGILGHDPEALGEFFGTFFMICFLGKDLEDYATNPEEWESPMMYEVALGSDDET